MPKTKAPAGSGKKPPRIHDKFFKDIFRNADCVISLIRAGAPEALFELVDWSTLKLEPQSIQVSGQNERFADLVLSVRLKDCKREASIVLLFEHKSYRDNALVRQMATNQFSMYLQDEFKSLIVPIVVTQAPSSKRMSAEFIDLFPDVPKHCWPVVAEFSVNFRCQTGKGCLDWCFYVCGYNEHITREEILSLETETPEEQQMVSAVEAFREEGRQEGRQEGRLEVLQEIAANLLQKGMGPGEIAEVTNLSRDQVETLQQKMNGASGD